MKFKIQFSTFGLLALLSASTLAETPAYTLNDCIRIGLERAVPVMNAERDRQIAEATMKQARATGLPQIDLIGNYSRNDGTAAPFMTGDILRNSYSGSIAASQTLYDGGKVFSAIRAANAYRSLTAQSKVQQEALLIRTIHTSFNGILLAQANVAVQEASVKQLTDFEKETQQKYEVGAASEFDWLTAQVRLANEKPKWIEARNALAIAKERFRNLIVLDSEDFKLNGELKYTPFEPNLMTLQSGAVSVRPELLVQEKTVALRREDLKASWSGYKPKVTADAIYTQENPDRYNGASDTWADHWSAGVTARWALFDGGTRRGEVLKKGLELAKAQADRDDLLRSVSLDVKSAWLDMMAARETITGTTETVKLAEKALRIAKTRYDAGLATYLEFTDSNLSLNTARLNHFQSLEKHLNAVVSLKYAAGILKSEMME
jgi:outer membrane protein TolC